MKLRSNSLIAVVELKWLFQGSLKLEELITKATLMVGEVGYPAGHKDRMVHDTLIAGISNDTVSGKISKKGPKCHSCSGSRNFMSRNGNTTISITHVTHETISQLCQL